MLPPLCNLTSSYLKNKPLFLQNPTAKKDFHWRRNIHLYFQLHFYSIEILPGVSWMKKMQPKITFWKKRKKHLQVKYWMSKKVSNSFPLLFLFSDCSMGPVLSNQLQSVIQEGLLDSLLPYLVQDKHLGKVRTFIVKRKSWNH